MTSANPMEQETLEQVRPRDAESRAALENKLDQASPAADNTSSAEPLTDAQQIRDELPQKSYPSQTEAEARLQTEGMQTGTDRPMPDSHLVDKAGRDITVRTWESDNHAYIRAYDGAKGEVPESVGRGTAGRADVHLERELNGETRARLNYIEVDNPYRGAGISSEMLNNVEQYAHANNATEIYGSIENEEARSFWNHMERKGEGWTIDPSKGYYGEVHKRLN